MADRPFYTCAEIAALTNATRAGDGERSISNLLTDSRRLIFPSKTLFFALQTASNDGHRFIAELYAKGVRAFAVQPSFSRTNFPEATFLVADNVLAVLQKLAQKHRESFTYPVVGIAGSNGKTVVKEWLFQFLSEHKRVVRSPRSYNSQIGVPLSLWQMGAQHEVALIEAGVSKQDEMLLLRDMIKPTIGIFTNIGHAHAEGFPSISAKAHDKAQLFSASEKIVFCADHALVKEALLEVVGGDETRLFGWSLKGADGAINIKKSGQHIQFLLGDEAVEFDIPFADSGSIENVLNAFMCAWHLGVPLNELVQKVAQLQPVEMRLEERKAINNNLLINDFYNSDPESVRIALELLMQQPPERQKIVVLSEFEGMPQHEKVAEYRAAVELLNGLHVQQVIGVGAELKAAFQGLKHPHQIFESTQELQNALPNLHWENAAILLKGARKFTFEKIANTLQEQVHQTWLEVNLSAMAQNLRFYRNQLQPKTKLMAMVKALSYGAGSVEIARLLQYNRVDYLAVAYVDEGIALRQGGIELPIMVINADPTAYSRMLQFNLEPELFSRSSVSDFLNVLDANYNGSTPFSIHLKIETGMHRLGLEEADLDFAITRINKSKGAKVASVFSHLAASDAEEHDDFTKDQISRFKNCADKLSKGLGYEPLLHITNTSGIARFKDAQFDMVRLGIGLYGVANSPAEQQNLATVTRWMTRISQLKNIAKGESVGYSRSFIAEKEMTTATLPVGYADGFFRALSNGKGHVFIANKKVPVVGRVCMDMIMVDVTNLNVTEGDVVELMGENISATEIGQAANTIAYEVLTHVSPRVPRVYVTE